MKKIFILYFGIIGMLGCSRPQPSTVKLLPPGDFHPVDTDRRIKAINLTTDAAGIPGLIWVEEAPGGAGDYLFFAKWNRGRSRFGAKELIVRVAKINTEAGSEPKLAFGKPGIIEVVYAVQVSETDTGSLRSVLYYQQSKDEGRSWTSPGYISRDTLARHDRSHFDLQTLKDGTIAVCWLDRSFGAGRGLMFNKTDTLGYFLPKGKFERLIDSFAAPDCLTAITASGSGRVDIAYGDFRADGRYPLAICSSPDGGHTFAPPRIVAGNGSPSGRGKAESLAVRSDSGRIFIGWSAAGSDPGLWYATIDRNTGIYKRYRLSGDAVSGGRISLVPSGNKMAVVFSSVQKGLPPQEGSIWIKFYPDGEKVLLCKREDISGVCAASLPDGLLSMWFQKDTTGQKLRYRSVIY